MTAAASAAFPSSAPICALQARSTAGPRSARYTASPCAPPKAAGLHGSCSSPQVETAAAPPSYHHPSPVEGGSQSHVQPPLQPQWQASRAPSARTRTVARTYCGRHAGTRMFTRTCARAAGGVLSSLTRNDPNPDGGPSSVTIHFAPSHSSPTSLPQRRIPGGGHQTTRRWSCDGTRGNAIGRQAGRRSLTCMGFRGCAS